jgi:hypothetical protein
MRNAKIVLSACLLMKKMMPMKISRIFAGIMRRIILFVFAIVPMLLMGQNGKSDIRGFIYEGGNGDRKARLMQGYNVQIPLHQDQTALG